MAGTSAGAGRPKSEVNRTKGKVNFTRDDVQAYYDIKVLGGTAPDEAAQLTGARFGIKVLVNPMGDLQLPPIVPDRASSETPPEPSAGGDGETPPEPPAKPKPRAKPKKQPVPAGTPATELPAEPPTPNPPAPNATALPNPAPETQAYTAFLTENPEFANSEFVTYVQRQLRTVDPSRLDQLPAAVIERLAETWWRTVAYPRFQTTNGLAPLFPGLYAAVADEAAQLCVSTPAARSHVLLSEYRRRGGLFLSEQQWAAKAIKHPGFWKAHAPAEQQSKPFTDPSIPLDVHVQVAKRHPGGIRGALNAVQAFLNLNQAGPQARTQLEKIKVRYQQEIAANAARRAEAVKRTRARFAQA